MKRQKKRIRALSLVQQRARELRQEMTPAEKTLWEQLRNRKLGGFKFRRQHPLDRFIVDFYCAACKLIVEVDGDIHDLQQERDAIRKNLEALRKLVVESKDEVESVRLDVTQLLQMHQNPDNYDFGTSDLEGQMTKALDRLLAIEIKVDELAKR